MQHVRALHKEKLDAIAKNASNVEMLPQPCSPPPALSPRKQRRALERLLAHANTARSLHEQASLLSEGMVRVFVCVRVSDACIRVHACVHACAFVFARKGMRASVGSFTCMRVGVTHTR
jgi:hypothetical protein